ncbi:hypothetical protein D3C80_1417060 [compost metagenome]
MILNLQTFNLNREVGLYIPWSGVLTLQLHQCKIEREGSCGVGRLYIFAGARKIRNRDVWYQDFVFDI